MQDSRRMETDGGSARAHISGTGVVLTNYLVGIASLILLLFLFNIVLDAVDVLPSNDLILTQRAELSRILLAVTVGVIVLFNSARRISPWPDMTRVDMQVLVWVPLFELTLLGGLQIVVALITAATFVQQSYVSVLTQHEMLTVFLPLSFGLCAVTLGFIQIVRTYLEAGMELGKISPTS